MQAFPRNLIYIRYFLDTDIEHARICCAKFPHCGVSAHMEYIYKRALNAKAFPTQLIYISLFCDTDTEPWLEICCANSSLWRIRHMNIYINVLLNASIPRTFLYIFAWLCMNYIIWKILRKAN